MQLWGVNTQGAVWRQRERPAAYPWGRSEARRSGGGYHTWIAAGERSSVGTLGGESVLTKNEASGLGGCLSVGAGTAGVCAAALGPGLRAAAAPGPVGVRRAVRAAGGLGGCLSVGAGTAGVCAAPDFFLLLPNFYSWLPNKSSRRPPPNTQQQRPRTPKKTPLL